jgi:putative transposase
MNENRVVPFRQEDEIDDPLTEILRTGARRLITRAVEIEFDTFLASNADLALPDGRQRVVRHQGLLSILLKSIPRSSCRA